MSFLARSALRCLRSSSTLAATAPATGRTAMLLSRSPIHPPSSSYTPIRTIKVAASAVAQDPHSSATSATAEPSLHHHHQNHTQQQQQEQQDKTLQSQIDTLITTLPLVQSLRADPTYTESRPHQTMPALHRPSHFVAGTLSGSHKITVPPFVWCATHSNPDTARSHTRMVSVFHIGAQLCGHPGFVHGGLLGVMFDEAFARCVSASFPSGTAMTANLNVDYRKPAVPERVYVLQAETVKVEGRKAWVEGSLTSLPGREEEAAGGESVMVAEARALFVEPKFAKSMESVYRQ